MQQEDRVYRDTYACRLMNDASGLIINFDEDEDATPRLGQTPDARMEQQLFATSRHSAQLTNQLLRAQGRQQAGHQASADTLSGLPNQLRAADLDPGSAAVMGDTQAEIARLKQQASISPLDRANAHECE